MIMTEKEMKLLEFAIEEGITKGIEEVGIENVVWCNIKLQED